MEGAAVALIMSLTSALMSLNAEWDITTLTELADFPFARQDAMRVELTPVSGAARLSMSEQMQVLVGRLTLASGGREVVVEAGQCLVEVTSELPTEDEPVMSTEEGDPESMFSSVEAGVCGG